MKTEIKRALTRNIIRPTVYKTLSRFPTALLVCLLADFFLKGKNPNLLPTLYAVCVAVFLLLAWIAYLRMDGMNLPKAMMLRVNLNRKPTRTYGDMIDHVDDEIVSFDDLMDGEKDWCCLIADGICAITFFVLSFL